MELILYKKTFQSNQQYFSNFQVFLMLIIPNIIFLLFIRFFHLLILIISSIIHKLWGLLIFLLLFLHHVMEDLNIFVSQKFKLENLHFLLFLQFHKQNVILLLFNYIILNFLQSFVQLKITFYFLKIILEQKHLYQYLLKHIPNRLNQ